MGGRIPHPVLIAGDFNLPVDSRIYAESWSGYLNAFSTAGWASARRSSLDGSASGSTRSSADRAGGRGPAGSDPTLDRTIGQ